MRVQGAVCWVSGLPGTKRRDFAFGILGVSHVEANNLPHTYLRAWGAGFRVQGLGFKM